jgi:hypothetical protein
MPMSEEDRKKLEHLLSGEVPEPRHKGSATKLPVKDRLDLLNKKIEEQYLRMNHKDTEKAEKERIAAGMPAAGKLRSKLRQQLGMEPAKALAEKE